MLERKVAPWLLVTPVMTANDDIHPPKLIYIPSQINMRKHKEYSRDLGAIFSYFSVVKRTYLSSTLSLISTYNFLGDFILAQKGIERSESSPQTKNECSQKRYTIMGPINPPTPMKPWVTSIQKESQPGGLAIITHTFRVISSREYPMQDKQSHSPSHRWDQAIENRPEMTPMTREPRMMML